MASMPPIAAAGALDAIGAAAAQAAPPAPAAAPAAAIPAAATPASATPASATPPAASDAAWRLDTPERPLTAGSPVKETVWSSARPPAGTFDRVALHRYRASGPTVATLLYLPGTNMNGVAALTDEAHNVWVYLAAHGVEVFTIDYRTHFVPPDTPAAALTALRGWDVSAFVADIQAAAAQARRESGRARLFVAGFSRGVSLAYAYTCTEPEAVAGLIQLDGQFKGHAPKNQFDYAAGLQKLEASKAWASDVAAGIGWQPRQQMMTLVSTTPGAAAFDAKYPTAGDQLATLLQNAWRPGGLTNPLGGVSKIQVLATLLGSYDRYYPAIQDVEGRSIGDRDDDPRTPVDDRWGELKLPVLAFTSTGMGGEWLLNSIYTADKSGSTDVTFVVLERYGHLDVLVSETAVRDVFEPAAAWIKARAAGPAPATAPTSAPR